MEIKPLLQRLQRDEKLDSSILERLDREGYIETRDVSHMQTHEGQKDLLFIFFTDKGKRLLEG
jgi:hypothetical protein